MSEIVLGPTRANSTKEVSQDGQGTDTQPAEGSSDGDVPLQLALQSVFSGISMTLKLHLVVLELQPDHALLLSPTLPGKSESLQRKIRGLRSR